MIGRAITARPWLLAQIAWKLQQAGALDARFVFPKPPPLTPEEESREYFRALDRFMELSLEHFVEEEQCLKKLRFFVATGSVFFVFGHSFWRTCMKPQPFASLRQAIREYGDSYQHEWQDRAML